jgi:hypothetical protein
MSTGNQHSRLLTVKQLKKSMITNKGVGINVSYILNNTTLI